jgi:hypothetical protein
LFTFLIQFIFQCILAQPFMLFDAVRRLDKGGIGEGGGATDIAIRKDFPETWIWDDIFDIK